MRIRGYAPGTLCWGELISPDVPGSAAFYGSLFGWQLTGPVDPAGVHHDFTFGGMTVAGATAAMIPGQPATWMTYIATDDADDAASRVIRAGGAVLAPPSTAGDRARTALCSDAEGAIFGVWQRITHPGARLANEPGTRCWGDLVSRDHDGAVSFYGAVFDWAARAGEAAPGMTYTEWHQHGRVLAGMVAMKDHIPPETPPYWSTIFEVDDCEATADRCAKLGGGVLLPPLFVGAGTYTHLVDPHGAPFGAIELIPELRGPLYS